MNPATGKAAQHVLNPPCDAVGGDAPPGPLVHLSAYTARGTIETLLRFDEFFGQHADHTVHAALRAFCAERGWHPVAAAGALLDQLGLHAWSLQRALDAAGTATPADPDASNTDHNTTMKEPA
jgi:hypothetical protein